jgi:hypothetical protein
MATPATSPARYGAVESARSGDLATAELHHSSGHDPARELHTLLANYAGSSAFHIKV